MMNPKATTWDEKMPVVLTVTEDGRRFIELPGTNRLLSDFAREVGNVIGKTNLCFQRNGLPFMLNPDGDGLQLVNAESFRTWAENYIVGYRMKNVPGNELLLKIVATMTRAEAEAVLASEFFINQLSPIERVNRIRMPTQRHDGRIELLPEGYDPESRTYTVPDGVEIFEMTRAEAITELDSLLAEFCFGSGDRDPGASERSRAVAFSAMLTMFAAGLLPEKTLRPAFFYLANAEGAGKTLLVKCAVVPVLGCAPTGHKPKDEDELAKFLLAAIMEARPMILFDNLKGHLSSPSLEGFLTSQTWSGRILGKNQSFTGTNHATVFITGNGCTVSPDIRRRALFVELFLEAERAEDRQFKQRLEVSELVARRGRILSALWTLILDWDWNGRRGPSRGHSGFPQWANVIAGIVENAGYACPLETPKIEAAADVDGQDMRALVEAMVPKDHPEVSETIRDFSQIVDLAQIGGLFSRFVPEQGDLERQGRAGLSRLLAKYDRRIIGHCRFMVEGKGHNRVYRAIRRSS